MRGIIVVPALVSALIGCASMPNTTATYYFPKSTTSLVVTQTLGCTNDKKKPNVISAFAVTLTTANSSDPGGDTGKIAYGNYGGWLSDADVGPTFTVDGRLSAINSTTTAEGSTIITSAATLATAAVSAFGTEAEPRTSPEQIKETCVAITQEAPGDKRPGTVTLTYSINFQYDPKGQKLIEPDPNSNPNRYEGTPSQVIRLKPDQGSDVLAGKLPVTQFPIVLAVKSASVDFYPAVMGDDGNEASNAPYGYQLIKMNKTATYELLVIGPDGHFAKGTPIWAGNVRVPIQDYYPLAVPSGAVFGNQSFKLTLSDAGDVTMLEYSTTTGTPGILNAAGSGVGAIPSDKTKAAAIQSQADLIAQQQRLVACKADPSSCK
jgi:hypothetical protein